MKLLVLNCGSSTLKFKLLRLERGTVGSEVFTQLAQGVIDKMGDRATLELVQKVVLCSEKKRG